MNERLKELRDRCTYVSPAGVRECFYIEKFAELIVKECYNVAEEHDCNLSGNGGEILKHFGVEN